MTIRIKFSDPLNLSCRAGSAVPPDRRRYSDTRQPPFTPQIESVALAESARADILGSDLRFSPISAFRDEAWVIGLTDLMGQVLDRVAGHFCNFGRTNYFVGLDVPLRTVAVCVIDADGGAFLEFSVPCAIEDIAHCLAGFDACALRIGFEAGAMSQLLFFGLRAAGFDVVCMEARQVNAALSAMRNKTDKTDARGIAQVLRSGWFNPVHMKSREVHAVRALLSSRKAVQRH